MLEENKKVEVSKFKDGVKLQRIDSKNSKMEIHSYSDDEMPELFILKKN